MESLRQYENRIETAELASEAAERICPVHRQGGNPLPAVCGLCYDNDRFVVLDLDDFVGRRLIATCPRCGASSDNCDDHILWLADGDCQCERIVDHLLNGDEPPFA